MAEIRAIRDAATLDAAGAQTDRMVNRYRGDYPTMTTCLEDDLEALLNVHRIPVRHRINVRTTDLAGVRRRGGRRHTKVIPRLLAEKSAMKPGDGRLRVSSTLATHETGTRLIGDGLVAPHGERLAGTLVGEPRKVNCQMPDARLQWPPD